MATPIAAAVIATVFEFKKVFPDKIKTDKKLECHRAVELILERMAKERDGYDDIVPWEVTRYAEYFGSNLTQWLLDT